MKNKELPTAREFLSSRRLFNTDYLINQEDEAIKITDMLEDYAHVRCEALRSSIVRAIELINTDFLTDAKTVLRQALKIKGG